MNNREGYISREDYINRIMAFADTPFVKILTGVRRCGKSTILWMLSDQLRQRGVPEDRLLHYRFDSMAYEGMTAKQMYDEIKGHLNTNGRTYLFLDEVQEIDGWERTVNALQEEYNADIYVTGSNSRMMSSEIATYLTGRYISFRIYPLSFAEYLRFKETHSTPEEPHRELANYIRLGGFPAAHLRPYTDDEIYTIVRDIYQSTVFSDIVRRNQIRKVDQLERIVRFSFDNVGKTFSAKSIADYMKSERRTIDNETVYAYLEKLESAYLLHRCARFDIQGKELLRTQEKFYLADTSLRYSVLGYDPRSAAAMLENVVFLELCRRGYGVHIGKLGSGEVDFVAERQNEKLYIQVTKEIATPDTERREYERLLDIRDNYPKYVLTTDDFSGGNYQGIQTMHVADFLLQRTGEKS